jgi:hypothetical protein
VNCINSLRLKQLACLVRPLAICHSLSRTSLWSVAVMGSLSESEAEGIGETANTKSISIEATHSIY